MMWNLLLYVLSVVTGLVLYYLYEERLENEDEIDSSAAKNEVNSSETTAKSSSSPFKSVETRISLSSLLSSFSAGDEKQDEASIIERFSTFEEVTTACRTAGLDRCNLILGVDYSASNEWQGRKTFGQGCLHKTSGSKVYNPYQKVIWVLGQTLAPFDEDGRIPAFGFADYETRNRTVFSLSKNGLPCQGFGEVLDSYNQMCQNIYYGGPTSLAPIINKAIDIVNDSGNNYHILIIITDGQLNEEELSKSNEALSRASQLPLSIITIGVGDGPWDQLQKLEYVNCEDRNFSNFRFVEYYRTTNKMKHPDALLALNALMDIPDQYRKITELGYIHKVADFSAKHGPVPSPSFSQSSKFSLLNKLKHKLSSNSPSNKILLSQQ